VTFSRSRDDRRSPVPERLPPDLRRQGPPPRPHQELESAAGALRDGSSTPPRSCLLKTSRRVQQWEQAEAARLEAALQRMLWNDMEWPDRQPAYHGDEPAGYLTRRIPSRISCSKPSRCLPHREPVLPRAPLKPFRPASNQCGHATKAAVTRHGAWFASHGMGDAGDDNIEMGEDRVTHHGVYSYAWFPLVQSAFPHSQSSC
jgi:hypothetical protein